MERNLLKNLQLIFFQYKWRFLKATTMVLISNLLIVSNPLIFRHALNLLSQQTAQALESPFKILWPWILILICLAVLAATFKYLMRMEFMEMSREVEVSVRAALFSRIQAQSQAFFDRHGVGELLSRLTSDISAYRELLSFALMYPLFCLTLIVPGLTALFMISMPLAFITLVPLLLIPVVNWACRAPIYEAAHAVQSAMAEMSNMVQENFTGIRIVKGYAIENMMLKRFTRLCKDFFKISFRLSWLQGIPFPLFNLLTKLATLVLVILSGFIILYHADRLNTADLLSFMWIQSYIYFPVIMLGWVLPIYQRGRAAYARIVSVYEEVIEIQDKPNSLLKIDPKADIEFRNLTFTYPNAIQPALKEINLKIKGGSFIGITGPLGAGKSTLFHLLNHDYEIAKNQIFIGGHEIHQYSLKSIHEAIITVEQSSFLFSRSLAENVKFGRAEATQEEVETAAEFADLHEAIMKFPGQYDTVVGERGITLSGGQRQRVAIARAFLVQRSILLLDDIFSAVDTATERRIFQSIKRHFKDKTVLIITHRLSILEQMEQVIFMSHGKIFEKGSPEELMANKGYYAALIELQQYEITNDPI